MNKEKTAVHEVNEETGLDVEVLRKVGDYHETGIEGECEYEYDYYPACFFVKRISGELVRQKNEIVEILLFRLERLPEVLALEHVAVIKDYIDQEAEKQKTVLDNYRYDGDANNADTDWK